MNFYLDFEATQFSAKIISVGCVAANGKSFYSLVRPVNNDKITRFITQLTGITPAMVRRAPDANSVFLDLKKFIRSQCDNEETFFFSYGDSDAIFLESTAYFMTNREAQDFAYMLGASLIDYSKVVCRFFDTGAVSLKRVLSYVRGKPVIQNHNALEDAEMLREIAFAIDNMDKPKVNPFREEMLEREAKQKENEKKFHCEGRVYMTSAIGDLGVKDKSFADVNDAVDYIFKKLLPISARDTSSKKKMKKKLEHAIRTETSYFNRNWTIIKKEE